MCKAFVDAGARNDVLGSEVLPPAAAAIVNMDVDLLNHLMPVATTGLLNVAAQNKPMFGEAIPLINALLQAGADPLEKDEASLTPKLLHCHL